MESARPSQIVWPVARNPFGYPFVRLARYIYAANPFYVISAGLVLIGLNSLFYDHDAAAHPNAITLNSWLQLGVLGGYASLLAGTSLAIVRLGQVWDDARTILLTLVLLFVAMSASFDKLVLTHSDTMRQVLLGGMIFAVGLSELLLWGLGIRLPALFRIPFHLSLALFFLYPILLIHLLDAVGATNPAWGLESTLWGVFLFPSVAAVITLLLLPAVWAGPVYTARSGTPWSWPWYPWSLFVYLGAGAVLRSFYLSMSFHAFPGVESGFGFYFLVPFLLSVCVVVFELGRNVGSAWAQRVALIAPVLVLPLSLPAEGHSPAYQHFLNVYMTRAGSPLVMAVWGLVILYWYAWLRGARRAEVGMVALLIVASIVGPDTVDAWSIRFPRIEPIGVASVWLVVQAILYPGYSWRWFLAMASCILALTIALWHTPFVAFGGMLPLHLLFGNVLMLGLIFQDGFARFLRRLGTAALTAAGTAALICGQTIEKLPDEVVLAYLVSVSLVAWVYWYSLRGPAQLFAAVAVTACLLAETGTIVAAILRRLRDPIAALLLIGGATSFLMAIGISIIKVVLWRRAHGATSRTSFAKHRWNGAG